MFANKTPKNRTFCAFCITFLTFFSFSILSCRAEATVRAQNDGSVQITFSGECGAYFENMIRSFSDVESDVSIFDATELSQNLRDDGFKDVSTATPTNAGLVLKMTDSGKSFLFTSGLLSYDKKNLVVKLSPEIMQKFYDAADEQTKTILDLFIAPVFNNEEMSEEEYLEVISSFYGNEAADEIKKCDLKLTLVSLEGKKVIFNLPLAKLLTLNETNVLKF